VLTAPNVDKEIGKITSAAISPGSGLPVALAYVRRNFTAPGTEVRTHSEAGIVYTCP
jgi:glycine cleavage system aminomethyltransferase T